MVEVITSIVLVGLTISSLSIYLNENNSEKRNQKKVIRDGFVFNVPDDKQERPERSHSSSGTQSSCSTSSSSTCDHNVRDAPLSTSRAAQLRWPAKQLKRLRKRSSVGAIAMVGGERTLHGHQLYIESECAICLEELLQPGC
jgi:hypothetical protein